MSGLVSLSVVGSGVYLYLNKDALIETARENAIETVTKTITESLPGLIKSSLPEMPVPLDLPKQTGGVLPF